eukprot:7090484-Ditylum_brightwellii.AAC.1
MVTALSDDEEKQEENDDVMLSSKSEDLVEQIWSPVDNGEGHIRQRDRDDFSVKVLGEVVLLAYDMGGGRLDGSITC